MVETAAHVHGNRKLEIAGSWGEAKNTFLLMQA